MIYFNYYHYYILTESVFNTDIKRHLKILNREFTGETILSVLNEPVSVGFIKEHLNSLGIEILKEYTGKGLLEDYDLSPIVSAYDYVIIIDSEDLSLFEISGEGMDREDPRKSDVCILFKG